MEQDPTKRSLMLGILYQMLPSVNDDYAAKLVYTLENKKELADFQKELAETVKKLDASVPMRDTLAARILLEELSFSTALLQLRIYKNMASISELAHAADLSEQDTTLLLCYYASFGAEHFFDTELATALKQLPTQETSSDSEKIQHVLHHLIMQAKEAIKQHPRRPEQNSRYIYQLADQYHFPLTLTSMLINTYAVPGAAEFAPQFETLFKSLQTVTLNKKLAASLAVKTLLCELTKKQARQIALTSKLLNDQILEEDLITISCRYLKSKTPQEIADTFHAVLERLPHIHYKEENLALAVHTLIDGTETQFEQAQQQAAWRKDRSLLFYALTKKPLFHGYEKQLAEHFAQKEPIDRIEQKAQEILTHLPYNQTPEENQAAVCQALLGKISTEEAIKQARQRCNTKSTHLTEKLAPRVLAQYQGAKTQQEIIAFFNQSLASYSFWTTDTAAHEFALHILLEQLNGTIPAHLAGFVLEMLENGSSLELVRDMRRNIQKNNTAPEELQGLLAIYKQARAVSQESQKDPSVEKHI